MSPSGQRRKRFNIFRRSSSSRWACCFGLAIIGRASLLVTGIGNGTDCNIPSPAAGRRCRRDALVNVQGIQSGMPSGAASTEPQFMVPVGLIRGTPGEQQPLARPFANAGLAQFLKRRGLVRVASRSCGNGGQAGWCSPSPPSVPTAVAARPPSRKRWTPGRPSMRPAELRYKRVDNRHVDLAFLDNVRDGQQVIGAGQLRAGRNSTGTLAVRKSMPLASATARAFARIVGAPALAGPKSHGGLLRRELRPGTACRCRDSEPSQPATKFSSVLDRPPTTPGWPRTRTRSIR